MDVPSIVGAAAGVLLLIGMLAVLVGTVVNTVIRAMRWHTERVQALVLRELGGQLQNTAFHLTMYPREGVQMLLTIGGLMQRGRWPDANAVMPTMAAEMSQLEKTNEYIR